MADDLDLDDLDLDDLDLSDLPALKPAKPAKARTPKTSAANRNFKPISVRPAAIPTRQVVDPISERYALILRAHARFHPTCFEHAAYEDRHFEGIYPLFIGV